MAERLLGLEAVVTRLTESVNKLTAENSDLRAQIQSTAQVTGRVAQATEEAIQPKRTGGTSALKPDKLPQFSGESSERVDTWLFQCKNYFLALNETNELACVRTASTYFRGNAAVWWQFVCTQIGLKARADFVSWEEFSDALLVEFQPADLIKSARDKLDRLHQLKGVDTYVSEFRRTIIQIPDLSVGTLVHKFI